MFGFQGRGPGLGGGRLPGAGALARRHRRADHAERGGPAARGRALARAVVDDPELRVLVVLGTDGFGRSDYRTVLRRFFEVNRYYVAVAALSALAADGVVPASAVTEAISRYDIDTDKPNPLHA